MDNFLNYAFPIGGGSLGAVISTISIHGMLDTALSAAIFAFVGGIVGWFVKLGFDYLKKMCNNN